MHPQSGGVHKNQLYIVNSKILHLSPWMGYIQMDFYSELKI